MRPRILIFLILAGTLAAQEVRPKDVREIGKAGSSALPKLEELLKNPSVDVRVEVVKQLIDIRTPRSVDLMVRATADNDPEVQMRATDGIVNFYLPGYVQTGFTSSIKRVGTSIKGKFTDTNDQVIDPYIEVRPEVIAALGKLVRGGGDMNVRANAARAIGILRGKSAVPDLVAATHSKDSGVMYESLIAIQKIGDRSVAPQISFLLHDLDQKVQLAAIETTGLLQNRDANADVADVLTRARDAKVKREAILAIARMPVDGNRGLFRQYLVDKDERMRAAAAEGFGRLHNPSDLPTLEKAWKDEGKTPARLSIAFALVHLGKTEITEFSPLQYLINTLNSAAYKGEASPLLIELARDTGIRQQLYGPLRTGTKDEKIGLCGVLALSGDQNTIAELNKLKDDPDGDVQKEALRAVRTLQNRL